MKQNFAKYDIVVFVVVVVVVVVDVTVVVVVVVVVVVGVVVVVMVLIDKNAKRALGRVTEHNFLCKHGGVQNH